jgi:hypothetical protein
VLQPTGELADRLCSSEGSDDNAEKRQGKIAKNRIFESCQSSPWPRIILTFTVCDL